MAAMKLAFATLAILAIASPAAAQVGGNADFTPFITFARSPSTVGNQVTVEIGVLRGEGRMQYWFRRNTLLDGPDAVDWTDTTRCSGARDAVVAATQIAPPRVAVPGIPVRPDGSINLTLDGVQYRFQSSAHYDGNGSSDISFSSNVGTPLSNWVEGSLEILEECWSDTAPVHGDAASD